MVGQVVALKCVCERCGHVMLRMDEPRWCGKCKSPYWKTPRNNRTQARLPEFGRVTEFSWEDGTLE
jgi:ribosomal protein S27AE